MSKSALKVRALPESQRRLNPEAFANVSGVGREIFVAKLREFANKIESGELDGCRAQWLDSRGGGESEMVTVIRDANSVEMLTTKIEEV